MKQKTKSRLLACSNTCGAITKILTKVGLAVFALGLVCTFVVDVAERREIRKKINDYNNIGNNPKKPK